MPAMHSRAKVECPAESAAAGPARTNYPQAPPSTVKSKMLYQRKIPTIEAFRKFRSDSQILKDVMLDLAYDYRRAMEDLIEHKDEYRGRALVRCFGSMIEAFTVLMRDVTCNMCELF